MQQLKLIYKPNTFVHPAADTLGCGCVKNRSDVVLSVWVSLLSVCSALVGNLGGGVHISVWGACVCVCELLCPAACMLTTLILYVEPLAWEPTHSASPPVSSSLSLSHSCFSLSLQNLFYAARWKSHIHNPTCSWAFTEFLKYERNHPLSWSSYTAFPSTVTQRRIVSHPGQGFCLPWRAEALHVSFQWHKIRPEEACVGVKDGNNQKCSNCVSPHELERIKWNEMRSGEGLF